MNGCLEREINQTEKETFENCMELTFESKSENERFARVAVAAFTARLNPTLEELDDLKTAVSEAVTNAIIHGYNCESGHKVFLSCKINEEERSVQVTIRDQGVGIADIEKAKEPMFTTKPDLDRSGMGFMFMEVFTDQLKVQSAPGQGTTVSMCKKFQTLPVE